MSAVTKNLPLTAAETADTFLVLADYICHTKLERDDSVEIAKNVVQVIYKIGRLMGMDHKQAAGFLARKGFIPSPAIRRLLEREEW